jgi:hypothetical protein
VIRRAGLLIVNWSCSHPEKDLALTDLSAIRRDVCIATICEFCQAPSGAA